MEPSLNDIALFVEVAKSRSFTRAAAALDMPASTLSRRISQLERFIGVRLLNRSTRKVTITEAGAVYFERCQHIITEARIAHEQLTQTAQQPKGRLRISMPSSFALTYMPQAVQEFGRLYPEISCEYDLGIQPIDLQADPFDIVIRLGQPPDSRVVSRLLAYAKFGLYASPEYLDKHGTPKCPGDLARHECLCASTSKEDSIWHLRTATREAEVAVKGQVAINNLAMQTHLAALGAGIVPASTHSLARSDDARNLVRILPEWELQAIPLVAMFPSRMMPAKTRAFIDFMIDKLAHPETLQAPRH